MPSDDRFALYYALTKTVFKKNYERLGDAERVVYLLDCLSMQVMNGGWQQWFDNWPDNVREDRIAATRTALVTVGLVELTLSFDNAVAEWRKGPAGSRDEWKRLTEEFDYLVGEVVEVVQTWAGARLDEF